MKSKHIQKFAATFGVSVALLDANARGTLSQEDCRFLTPLERTEYIRLAREELGIAQWDENASQ